MLLTLLIGYFLVLALVIVFFRGASIVNKDYDARSAMHPDQFKDNSENIQLDLPMGSRMHAPQAEPRPTRRSRRQIALH